MSPGVRKMAIDSGDDDRSNRPSAEGTFLDRWAKRKADVREAELNERDTDVVAEVDAETSIISDGADDPPLVDEPDGSELTVEDVEKLDKDSDFTAFLKAAVPAEIKRLALKKLWASDPVYNVVDGLVEYGEDYSQLHVNVGPIKSAYQVGKGYVTNDDEDDDPQATETQTAAADDLGESTEKHLVEDSAVVVDDIDKDENTEFEEVAEVDAPNRDRADPDTST